MSFVRLSVQDFGGFTLKVMIASATLLPYARISSGIPGVRLEIVVGFMAWAFLLSTGRPLRMPKYLSFGLFALSVAFSMTYGAILRELSFAGRDLWEMGKVFLYWIIFTVAANVNVNPTRIKHYYKFILVSLALAGFVGFLQYFDFADFNRLVSAYYAPTHLRDLLVHGRITGTASNPNEFGAFMVLASSLALSGVLYFRERSMRMISWGMLAIYTISLLLTQSRSALVAQLISWSAVLFFFLRHNKVRYKLLRLAMLILISAAVGVLVWQVIPEKALSRFSELRNFAEATSWQARVRIWNSQYAIWLESPWIGWGPGKSSMTTVVDNEWLLILRRYGLVGLFAFLGLCHSLLIGLANIRKRSRNPTVTALAVGLESTAIGYSIYMIAAPVYHSMQLMALLLSIMGLTYSAGLQSSSVYSSGGKSDERS